MPKKILLRIHKNPLTYPVLIVTVFTFISRFLGFVRQYLILRNLTPIDSDLLLSANNLPENISVILLMGTIYSSVLPIASRLESANEGEKKVSDYLNLITISLSLVVSILVILGIVFSPQIVRWPIFTSSAIWQVVEENNLIEDYVLASRILFLFPLAFASQAILGVFVTLKKRFLIYSLAGVVTNVATIFALIFSDGNFVKVAIGMVIGGYLASLLFLYACLQDGYLLPELNLKKFKASFQELKTDYLKTWQLFLPRILIIDGYYIAFIILRMLSDTEGQITAFDIGNSIQSAFFIIITSLGTVVFPDLAKLFLHKDQKKSYFWKKTSQYIWLSGVVGVGVTILTMIFSPLILKLFELLGFKQGTGDWIVLVSQITAISLIFRSMREILVKYIYIRERVWQPLLLSLFSLVSTVIVSIGLWFFKISPLISVSIGFIAYNLVWVILALNIFYADRRQSLHSN